jgi:hypothetical protein
MMLRFDLVVRALIGIALWSGCTESPNADTDTPAICANDAIEENNTQEAAAWGLTSETGLTLWEDDWYLVEVQPGERVTVDAVFGNLLTETQVEMFNPIGQSVVTSTGEWATEHLTWANLFNVPVTRAIHVTQSQQVCNPYDLTILVDPIPPEACGDDIDNDFDGFTDCLDYDCVGSPQCDCPPDDGLEENNTLDEASSVRRSGFSRGWSARHAARREDWCSSLEPRK